MSDMDREVQRIEGGDAWRETDVVVQIEVEQPLDKVVPVRLTAEQWEAVRRQARDLGIGPSAVIRAWVLERLSTAPVP